MKRKVVSRVRTENVKGACRLLSKSERGGGAEQGRHVPHHLFAQRLYSIPTLVPRFGNELQVFSRQKCQPLSEEHHILPGHDNHPPRKSRPARLLGCMGWMQVCVRPPFCIPEHVNSQRLLNDSRHCGKNCIYHSRLQPVSRVSPLLKEDVEASEGSETVVPARIICTGNIG